MADFQVPHMGEHGIYAAYREIKYTGAIHLKEFYKDMHEWILENDYAETRKDTDFPEIMYWESRAIPGAAEIWIWWRPYYIPQSNPFYRRVLRIDIQSLNTRDIEVMTHNNQKKKVQWGEHKVMINCILEIDWEGLWKKNPIARFLKPIFENRLFHKDLHKHEHEAVADAEKLVEWVKNYYGLRHYKPRHKPFRPQRGLGEAKPYGVVKG